MRNLVEYAKKELELAGLFDKDSDYAGMLGKSVLALIKVFSDEVHSGASAARASSLFNKLSRYEPLTPLTGEDNEWNEIMNGVLQNKRCSTVFKENGEAHDINGIIFREPNGVTYTSSKSRVSVMFPYTPTSKIVDVEGERDE